MKAFVEEFESIGSFILDIHDYLIIKLNSTNKTFTYYVKDASEILNVK
jgi:hypothetical protein